jgi:ATP-dependent Clp protease ATP-binding subunit ClpC
LRASGATPQAPAHGAPGPKSGPICSLFLRAQRIEVEFTDDAIRLLAHEGFDREFGARPLRRTIQRLVENELSRMVLAGTIRSGARVRVDELEGELHLDVETEGVSEARDPEPERAAR